MAVQGDRGRNRLAERSSGFVVSLLVFSAGLSGCSTAPLRPLAVDHSSLPPIGLMKIFLENELEKEAVKFVFKGEIEVGIGKRHRFRGYCGYTPCGSLRAKLLGPLGFTLLDYVNAEGQVTLIVNHLTEEGDEPGLDGLLKLLGVFSRALLDRCRSAGEYVPEARDATSATFSVRTETGESWRLTLDRKTGALVHQSSSGPSTPEIAIDYSAYDRGSDGYWMPGEIGVHGVDADAGLSIRVAVKRWNVRADLPEGFFAAD